MAEADDIWRSKEDQQVLAAVASIDDYTDEGRNIILAEAARRGLRVAPLLQATASLSAGPPDTSGRCAYCDTRILFGGRYYGQFHFCNEACRQAGIRLAVSRQIPDGVVQERVSSVFHGRCPRCDGPGPVDVHTSHRVYSILVVTAWSNPVAVVCAPCGRTAKLNDAVLSLLVGWWGVPWGFVMTPIQIGRNVAGLLNRRDLNRPSARLDRLVRLSLAEEFLATPANNAPQV